MVALRLHTVKDFVSQFPSGSITEKEANALLEQHGTYRLVGKTKFLTERDMLDCLQRIAAKRITPPEPDHEEVGQVVYIGNPAANSEDELIWIGWCPIGDELYLLDRVRLGAQEHVMILAHDNATYGDVLKLKSRLKSSRAKGNPYGNWFHRSDIVMSEIAKHNDEGDED